MNKKLIYLFWIACFSNFINAESKKNETVTERMPTEYSQSYYELEEDIATNYKRIGDKLGFVRVSIALQLEDGITYDFIEENLPIVQSTIIEILNEETGMSLRAKGALEDISLKMTSALEKKFIKYSGKKVIKKVIITKFYYT